MLADQRVLDRLRNLAEPIGRAPDQLARIAEIIRSARDYRWVGIYQVAPTEIIALAWTGTEAPAHPRFPVTQGLCGSAVKSRSHVVVGDVQIDPRYLITFGSTRSEAVVPVLDTGGNAAGLIDVESEHRNAFDDHDVQFLQACARVLLPVFW